MLTQKGANTSVVGIEGNFDDAQTGVKKIFGDKEFAKELDAMGFQLSSANSINIGRLVPQVVYYVYAYAKLLANGEIEKMCIRDRFSIHKNEARRKNGRVWTRF